MSSDQTLVRALHDLGGAAWFGGSLMGAVGLNGATRHASDSEALTVSAAGWARWAPVAAAAIGTHLVGGLGLTVANRGRVTHQKDTQQNTVVKTAVTVAAMATTAYSGVLGAKLAKAAKKESASAATVPSSSTSAETAKAQQQLRVLQWVTPVLTGWLIVLGAQQGEQQKPAAVLKGYAAKALDSVA